MSNRRYSERGKNWTIVYDHPDPTSTTIVSWDAPSATPATIVIRELDSAAPSAEPSLPGGWSESSDYFAEGGVVGWNEVGLPSWGAEGGWTDAGPSSTSAWAEPQLPSALYTENPPIPSQEQHDDSADYYQYLLPDIEKDAFLASLDDTTPTGEYHARSLDVKKMLRGGPIPEHWQKKPEVHYREFHEERREEAEVNEYFEEQDGFLVFVYGMPYAATTADMLHIANELGLQPKEAYIGHARTLINTPIHLLTFPTADLADEAAEKLSAHSNTSKRLPLRLSRKMEWPRGLSAEERIRFE